MMCVKDGPSGPMFGEGVRQALAKKGVHLTLEEAARLSRALLHLAEFDLLEAVEEPEVEASESDTG